LSGWLYDRASIALVIVNNVVDFLSLSNVRNDFNWKVFGVLVHVNNDLLNADLNGVLELVQILLLVMNLAQRELQGVGIQNIEIFSLSQFFHDLLLLNDVFRSHLARVLELKGSRIQSEGIKKLLLPVVGVEVKFVLFLGFDVFLQILNVLLLPLLHPLVVLLDRFVVEGFEPVDVHLKYRLGPVFRYLQSVLRVLVLLEVLEGGLAGVLVNKEGLKGVDLVLAGCLVLGFVLLFFQL